jgi:hypothetical protein
MIEAEPAAAGADPELAAIEAGAQDFEPARKKAPRCSSPTPPTSTWSAARCRRRAFTVLSAKLGYKAKNPVDPASLSAGRRWRKSKPSWPPSTRTTTCRTSSSGLAG